MQAVLPEDIHVSFEFDQSPLRDTCAIRWLVTEGVLGAVLTGLMVLLFLRDWRSVLVVVLNIPLALMAAVIGLWLSGNTINLMTWAAWRWRSAFWSTRRRSKSKTSTLNSRTRPNIARAVRLGNAQTAIPRLVGDALHLGGVLAVRFFMEGAARALFVPLSLAVGFSMLASYILSSTFVPVVSSLAAAACATARFAQRVERLRARLSTDSGAAAGGALAGDAGVIWPAAWRSCCLCRQPARHRDFSAGRCRRVSLAPAAHRTARISNAPNN